MVFEGKEGLWPPCASGKGWTTGSKGLFRPPLKRYTTVMREGMTVARFLDLVAAQNPGFLWNQLHLWHLSCLPSGDSLAVFGVELEMVQFVERRMG